MKYLHFTQTSVLHLLAAFMLCISLLMPVQAFAFGTDEKTYDETIFPPTPIAPTVGETRPRLYDLQVAAQMKYWSDVIDDLNSKIDANKDTRLTLNNAEQMWSFIQRKSIAIDSQQRKVLCLFMQRDPAANPPESLDTPPTNEQMTNFPAWPECGGILENMFGPGSVEYLIDRSNNTDDQSIDVVNVFRYWLETIGLSTQQIEGTIQAQGMVDNVAGAADFSFGQNTLHPDLECYDAQNNIKPYEVTGCGVLCTVTRIIMGLLEGASMLLYDSIVGDSNFQAAITAALLLYTVIYGAMVLLGVVRVGLGDALVRIAKLGAIALLITSSISHTFFHMVRCFFIEGTTYLIQAVSMIGLEATTHLTTGAPLTYANISVGAGADLCGSSATSGSTPGGPVGPLVVLESLVTQVFSPHMFLVFITLIMTKSTGIILAIFLAFGVFGFVMALMSAVTIYLTSLIAQYLLLSLLPFFLAFLLFERTKYLFEGWINQLISYSLAPIFLFAYISLFILVIEAALAQILDVGICWDKWIEVAWVFDIYKWTFWDFTTGAPVIGTPFGFFDIMIFILLVLLMREFQDSVEQIAIDIGNSYVHASGAANAMRNWFKGKTTDMRHKAISQLTGAGKGAATMARAAVGGHKTDSSSGQTGVGGVAGAKASVGSRPSVGGKSDGGGGGPSARDSYNAGFEAGKMHGQQSRSSPTETSKKKGD